MNEESEFQEAKKVALSAIGSLRGKSSIEYSADADSWAKWKKALPESPGRNLLQYAPHECSD